MKGLRNLIGAAALLAAVAPVSAADLSTKDSPTTLVPIPGPSGFYVELGVGYGFSQSNLPQLGTTLSLTGAEFEGRLGYDKKWLGNWGSGIYAEGGNGFDVNGKLLGFIKLSNQWNFGAGIKPLWYDHGGGQVYSLLGYSCNYVNVAGQSSCRDGMKYGGGITLKVLGNAYVGLEFTQTRDVNANLFGFLSDKQVDDRAMVRLGFTTN